MPDDALLQSLGRRLPDQFSHDLLNGALHVLGQADNKMRAHQFAATLRELIGQVLKIMAPTAKMAVDTSSWRDKPLQTTNLGVRSSNLFGRAINSMTYGNGMYPENAFGHTMGTFAEACSPYRDRAPARRLVNALVRL